MSFVALVVAGIAAANQLASLKRPRPSIELIYVEQLVNGLVEENEDFVFRDFVVATTIIRVYNRGSETMYLPAIYDWTPNGLPPELQPDIEHIPPALEPHGSLEISINHPLVSKHDRVIGLVWEESSLFRRTPKTMGIRIRARMRGRPDTIVLMAESPSERWKRVGPFHRMGWQKRGSLWSLWKPVFSGPTQPGDSSTHGFTSNALRVGSLEGYPVVYSSGVPGRNDITPEQVAQYRKAGEALPGN